MERDVCGGGDGDDNDNYVGSSGPQHPLLYNLHKQTPATERGNAETETSEHAGICDKRKAKGGKQRRPERGQEGMQGNEDKKRRPDQVKGWKETGNLLRQRALCKRHRGGHEELQPVRQLSLLLSSRFNPSATHCGAQIPEPAIDSPECTEHHWNLCQWLAQRLKQLVSHLSLQ